MNEQTVKAMILSVGGTPSPLARSIARHKPEFVCFLASQQSVDLVPEIKGAARREGADFRDHKVLCEEPEDLVHCYEKAAECAARAREASPDPAGVVVDYTGGTKTMSAALALATVGHGFRFSYVGGAQRTKDGLGVVISGTERVRTGVSPWEIFAVEEKRQVGHLVSLYQYEAALLLAQGTAARLSGGPSRAWAALGTILKGYQHWDNFEHKEAVKTLSKGLREMEAVAAFGLDAPLEKFLDAVRENFAALDAMNRETGFFEKMTAGLVRDLVANARRRHSQARYDDAVARLYRSLEMAAQVAFQEMYGTGTTGVNQDVLPESLREEYVRRYYSKRDKGLNIPLDAAFRALEPTGHPFALEYQKRREDFRKVLVTRNNSILAHGGQPVGRDTCRRMMEIVENSFVSGPLVEFARLDW